MKRDMQLDPARAHQRTQRGSPDLDDLSQSMLQATEPIVHEYERRLAQAIAQQIEQLDPERLARGAEDGRQQPPREQTRDAGEEWARSPRQEPSRPPGTADGSERDSGRTDMHTEHEARGDTDMPTNTEQTDQAANQETAQRDGRQARQPEAAVWQATRAPEPQRQPNAEPAARAGGSGKPRYVYDPRAATRAGLVHFAAAWADEGSTYAAISVYERVLADYPDTEAAAAATQGLLDLAVALEQQGRFNTALNIYYKLERLVQ